MSRAARVIGQLALVLIGSTAALAQAPERAQQGAAAAPERARMERNLRQAMWRATKQRVGLSDSQMDRLGTVSRDLEPRRQALVRREREARRSLRDELAAAQPDQERAARLLNELQAVQRTRVDLMGDEQKQLAEFMTPVQRARYFAMQEQFRRRLEQLRRPGAPGAPEGEGMPARPRRRLP